MRTRMGKYIDLQEQKRGHVDGKEVERKGEKAGKAVLKQANKEALASQKLQEALLAPSVNKSRAKKEVKEVVDYPPAKEMGAPEFAEESLFSLLESHTSAEVADINAFIAETLGEGKTIEGLSDTEYRDLLKQKDQFALFVARRLYNEASQQMWSRPLVDDGLLVRVLELDPTTVHWRKRIEEEEAELKKLQTKRQALLDQRSLLEKNADAMRGSGMSEASEVLKDATDKLLALDKEIEKVEQEQTQFIDDLRRDSLDDQKELRLQYLQQIEKSKRALSGVLRRIAELSPKSIGKDGEGQVTVAIDAGEREVKRVVESFLIEIADPRTREGVHVGTQERMNALSLRTVLEIDWVRQQAVQFLHELDRKVDKFTPEYYQSLGWEVKGKVPMRLSSTLVDFEVAKRVAAAPSEQQAEIKRDVLKKRIREVADGFLEAFHATGLKGFMGVFNVNREEFGEILWDRAGFSSAPDKRVLDEVMNDLVKDGLIPRKTTR